MAYTLAAPLFFYFVRYRPYDDPKVKAKIDQADKEMQKWNKARFQLTDELKAKRVSEKLLISIRCLALLLVWN